MLLYLSACFLYLDLGSTLHLSIIHDEVLNLTHPRSRYRVENWVSLLIKDSKKLHENLEISHSFVSTDSILSGSLKIISGTGVEAFLILTHCEPSNLLTDHILQFTKPVLRFEFALCRDGKINQSIKYIDFVDIYRIQPELQYLCVSVAFNQWIRSLNRSSFRFKPISRVLQECANVSDTKWQYSFHSTSLLIPETVSVRYLNGKKLHFASLERPPFVTLHHGSRTEGDIQYGGFCYEIIENLKTIYNFSYSVTVPRDTNYGTELANGSWNGIIEMITKKEIDLGMGPFSVTFTRQKVSDFTASYYEDPTAILIPPPTEDTRLFACTKPFRWEVWMCLLLTMLLLPLILRCQYKVYWRLKTCSKILQNEARDWKTCPGYFEQFIFVFSVISSQSGQNIPSIGHAPRLLAAVWCLSCVIIIYLYVGTLMSFLSVPKLRPILESLQEVPESTLSFGVRRGTALESLFLEAKEGTYGIIAAAFRKDPRLLVSSDKEGLERVVNGSYAFIKEKSYLEFAMEQDFEKTGQCRLSLAKEEFYKANFAFPATKGSFFLPLFNKQILHMLQAGLMDYWKKKYWPRLDECKDFGVGQSTRKLTLVDLQSAFLVLGIGIVLGLIAYLIEWVHYYMIVKN